jgi:hypothetical protein
VELENITSEELGLGNLLDVSETHVRIGQDEFSDDDTFGAHRDGGGPNTGSGRTFGVLNQNWHE